jgi:hypothetical protein
LLYVAESLKVATEVSAGREMFSDSKKQPAFKVGDNSLDSRYSLEKARYPTKDVVSKDLKLNKVFCYILLFHSKIINGFPSDHAEKQQRNWLKMSVAVFYATIE